VTLTPLFRVNNIQIPSQPNVPDYKSQTFAIVALLMSRRIFRALIYLPIITIITAYLLNRLMTGTIFATHGSSRGAIIVGSGLAGLSAASQLVSRGVPVCLIERQAKPGGNSIKASSGINGAPTRFQSVKDAAFYDDTLKSAGAVLVQHRDHRQKLISTLTSSSASAIDWLVDENFVDLSHVAQLGGHSKPRTHRGSGQTPPGAAIVNTLLKSLKENPLFHLKTSCAVSKVLVNEWTHAVGVEYICEDEPKTLFGPVIFASGGFAGDARGMLAEYRADLAGFPSTNDPRPGSQNLLTDVGAQLRDMKLVQIHPTGFVDPKDQESQLKFLAAELLRGEGGLLLVDGKRFVNEMETRQNVTNAIMSEQPYDDNPKQWNVQLVLDEGSYNASKSHVDFYLWKGLMHKTAVGDLGPWAVLVIQEYADAAAEKAEDSLGRTTFGQWSLKDVTPESVIYVGRVTPVVHFTMGGVVINEKSEVLDAGGKPIAGLFAAGEVTGGIHGENRLGGSSLLECVVYGRIAGDQAAEYLKA
jgi:FAD-dependent fumarate reductase